MYKIKVLKGVNLRRADDGSAGYDIFSIGYYTIPVGEQILIPVGIYSAFDHRIVGICKDKSGNAWKSRLSVHGGVIDSSYRGEWKVILENRSENDISIEPGKGICQVLFIELPEIEIEYVDSVDDLGTSDRVGGFGSTKLGI